MKNHPRFVGRYGTHGVIYNDLPIAHAELQPSLIILISKYSKHLSCLGCVLLGAELAVEFPWEEM